MKRKNFPVRKEKRRAEALKRQVESYRVKHFGRAGARPFRQIYGVEYPMKGGSDE